MRTENIIVGAEELVALLQTSSWISVFLLELLKEGWEGKVGRWDGRQVEGDRRRQAGRGEE